MITSPYNFVPLSEKVVSPYWAKQVSHDIPFEDAQSGVLDLIIKAESPIYVRNGTPRDASEDPKNAFNNINEQYFIPGSSVKGMLRSVMEIMSFGRMGNKVNDHKYSVRDFQNNDIYPKSELAREVDCGWLYKNGEEYFLIDCGKPGRISHRALDTKFKTSMSAFYKTATALADPKSKSAKAKYDQFVFKKEGHQFSIQPDSVGRPVCSFDQEGAPATIVFSGQASIRKEEEGTRPSGKHLEYVFFNRGNEPEKLTPEVIKNFFFAYYDHDRPQQKEDWKWRKPQLDSGEKIPVFFRRTPDGKAVLDMGLTLLYKITYKNSIVELINLTQESANGFDLAETIFGYTEGGDALKGRVHVGQAFAKGNIKSLGLKNEVLAGPKASYYPTYIEQKNKAGKVEGDYKTFMNDAPKIKGWKRYPVHNGEVKRNAAPEIRGVVNEKMGTKFEPLASGTEFNVQIHYHNLRKEELGALISAITFHNTAELYHSIGTGKPLGYGKISIQIKNFEEQKKIELLRSYELFMDWSLKHSTPLWFQLPQINELFAMAKPGNDDLLKYMKMKKKITDEDDMDFITAKKQKLTLQSYSVISKNLIDVQSLGSQSELNEISKRYTEEENIFNNQLDIVSLKESKLKSAENDFSSGFKQRKHQLLEQLAAKREGLAQKEKADKEALEQHEKQNRKKADQERAMLQGFDPGKIDPSNRNAFDELGKEILRFSRIIYSVNDNQLKEKFPEGGYLPEQEHGKVTALLQSIFANIKAKKDKEKWLQKPMDKNHIYLKIRLWLGDAAATSLIEMLNKV